MGAEDRQRREAGRGLAGRWTGAQVMRLYYGPVMAAVKSNARSS